MIDLRHFFEKLYSIIDDLSYYEKKGFLSFISNRLKIVVRSKVGEMIKKDPLINHSYYLFGSVKIQNEINDRCDVIITRVFNPQYINHVMQYFQVYEFNPKKDELKISCIIEFIANKLAAKIYEIILDRDSEENERLIGYDKCAEYFSTDIGSVITRCKNNYYEEPKYTVYDYKKPDVIKIDKVPYLIPSNRDLLFGSGYKKVEKSYPNLC